MWKKEYAKNRKKKYHEDEEYRQKRLDQSVTNPEERKKYLNDYYKNNPEKYKLNQEKKDKKNARRREQYANDESVRLSALKQAKEWQENNPDKRKNQRLKQYGITLDDMNKIMEEQEHKCAICGYEDIEDKKMFPVIDHCHTSGIVRGILCSKCNKGIGLFNDNVDFLISASNYLKKFNTVEI